MDCCEYSILHLNFFWFYKLVLTKLKQGKPAGSERMQPVKIGGKESKGPFFVSKPPMIHFKVQLCGQSPAKPAR